MKTVTDLTAQVVKNISVENAVSSAAEAAGVSVAEARTASVVNAVIKELKACCPAWRLSWANDSEAESFRISLTRAFLSEGVTTVEQLRHMVRWLRSRDEPYLPSIGQIVSRCKPTAEALGLPDVSTAYRQAAHLAHPCAGDDVRAKAHPVVWHATTQLFWELGNLSEKESFPLFERVYEQTIKAFADGQPLREVPKALPPPQPTAADKERSLEAGRAAMAEIRRKLGMRAVKKDA